MKERIIEKLEDAVEAKIEALKNVSDGSEEAQNIVKSLQGLSEILDNQKNRDVELEKTEKNRKRETILKVIEIAVPILVTATLFIISLDFETDHVTSRSVTNKILRDLRIK